MYNHVSVQPLESCIVHRLPWKHLDVAGSPRASRERRRHDQSMLCYECFLWMNLSTLRFGVVPRDLSAFRGIYATRLVTLICQRFAESK
jgi:hypothetical protein